MTENTGIIYNIQRFSLNDGPGIRTTVFLKGCMLRCVWCHNPESRSMKKQLMLNASRCIGCGLCLTACEKGLHRFSDGVHDIDRAHCTACGACAAVCAGALETVGRTVTVDEVLREVMKDALFYKNSGGGMTLSGGEPLMQPGFTLELLRGAKEKGLDTAVETCGYAGWDGTSWLYEGVSAASVRCWHRRGTCGLYGRRSCEARDDPCGRTVFHIPAAGL